MPDESCRKCGAGLKNYLKCFSCNIVIQEICLECKEKTLPRYHSCYVVAITS